MAKEQALCNGKIHNAYNFMNPWVPCGNKAKTEAGYCKLHDPEIIKEKTRVKESAWEKEYQEKKSKRELKQRKREAGDEAILVLRQFRDRNTINSCTPLITKFFEKYGGI